MAITRRGYYQEKAARDTLRATEAAHVELLAKSAATYQQLHEKTLQRLNEALREYDWIHAGERVGPRNLPRLTDEDTSVHVGEMAVRCPLTGYREDVG